MCYECEVFCMYARCVICGRDSIYLVDTADDTTETRCKHHADAENVVNHKRSVFPLSDDTLSDEGDTRFKASCHVCAEQASHIIRFKDNLGVYSTEARCSEHKIDKGTQHSVENIDVRAEDCA